jgi:hypothetical protein
MSFSCLFLAKPQFFCPVHSWLLSGGTNEIPRMKSHLLPSWPPPRWGIGTLLTKTSSAYGNVPRGLPAKMGFRLGARQRLVATIAIYFSFFVAELAGKSLDAMVLRALKIPADQTHTQLPSALEAWLSLLTHFTM